MGDIMKKYFIKKKIYFIPQNGLDYPKSTFKTISEKKAFLDELTELQKKQFKLWSSSYKDSATIKVTGSGFAYHPALIKNLKKYNIINKQLKTGFFNYEGRKVFLNLADNSIWTRATINYKNGRSYRVKPYELQKILINLINERETQNTINCVGC